MEEKRISISDALRFGWEGMKKHFLLYASVLLLAFLSHILLSMIFPCNTAVLMTGADPVLVKESVSSGCWLASVLGFLVNTLFLLGLTHISLQVARGEEPTFKGFWSKSHLYLKMLGAEVLYSLIVFAGLLLLIFPGVIWALRYCMYPFLVVDKQAGPVEALKLSAKATYGAKWDLLGWYMIIFLLLLAGALLLGVGLLVAYPIMWMSKAYIYRKLIGENPSN